MREGLPMNMYLLLYSGGDMPKTDVENKTMADAWGVWLSGLGDRLVDGNPFSANAKRVSPDGAVADGPVGPMVSGYSLIKTGSMDDVVEMARGCPAKLSGATISIFEVQ
jgi:hypothetical protein